MRIRPFKFAKFELSSSILALEIQFMLSETWQSQMKFGSPVGRRFLMGTVYTLYQGCWSRGAKGALPPPPVFSRSVNPISTREGGRLCPSRYYVPPSQIFRPSYGPVYLWGSCCATTYTAFDFQYRKDRSEIFIQNMFERSNGHKQACNVRTARKMYLQIQK